MNAQQTPREILIVGASIAGPALAFWLTRQGHHVTIVERAKTRRKGGYAVDIRGAAVTVVERMGILAKLQKLVTQNESVQFVNAEGCKVAEMPETGNGRDMEIMHEDLTAALQELINGKVEYVWGESIESLIEKSDHIEVAFTQGAVRTFDMVVGADGQHSRTRELLFGDEAQFSHSLDCYIAIYTIPNYLDAGGHETIYSMPGKTAAVYAPRPGSKDARALFMFQSAPLQYDRHNTAVQKQLLLDAFKNEEGWEVPKMLQFIPKSTDFYFDSLAQIQLERWHKGRVVLLGDAAYGPSPASGQGTTLALVGAYILAQRLEAVGDVAEAADKYEQAMREYVQKNQKIGVMAANSMVEGSARKIRMRNRMIRMPFVMDLMVRQVQKMIDKASNAIKISD